MVVVKSPKPVCEVSETSRPSKPSLSTLVLPVSS
jgi:hypothetical protein